MQRMQGGCHCGRVRFRVTADLDRVTDCNCSICTKKGMLHLIVPPERFALLSGKEELTTYEFNTGTAKHTFCRHCGIHPFYVPRSDPDKIDVNVRCLEGVDPDALAIEPFDGRNWEQAIGTAPWKQAGAVEVRREEISSPEAAALSTELNADLSKRYPEEGACHFRLDAAEVEAARGAFLVARLRGEPVGCGAIRRIEAGNGE